MLFITLQYSKGEGSSLIPAWLGCGSSCMHADCLLLLHVGVVLPAVGDKLLEQVFNLKFMAKQLNRSAIKCEKDEKAERLKVKKAIEKGNTEGAKIYAQNAIRKKHEQLNYLKLASRLDAVVSRLDTQAKMSMVNRNMMAITKNLEKALQANNLEKVGPTSPTLCAAAPTYNVFALPLHGVQFCGVCLIGSACNCAAPGSTLLLNTSSLT
jgi:hypothetical protein